MELDAAEAGDANPMLGLRERFVRDWPGPAAPTADDPVFAGGWRAAALDPTGQASLVEALEPAARASFDALAADRVALAEHLLEREGADGLDGGPDERIPRTLSASSMMDYALCPKRFYWSRVRPLPRFSGPAARIGTEIHRWIERRAAGQGRLLEADDGVDLTQEELAGDPGRVERLRQAFLSSPYAGRTPLFAERAFLLRVGGFAVSGRIDAIYGEADGAWDIVDWKTGVGEADPLQLELYGLACMEIWHKRPEELSLTYYYLARDEAVSIPMGDAARGAGSRRGVARSHRVGRVRADARSLVRVLRLQELLRRREGLARGQRLGARPGVEPLDLFLEGPVVRGRVVAADHPGRDEPDPEARLRWHAHAGRGAEPLEVAGGEHHRAARADLAIRGIVDDDGRAPERVRERIAARIVVGRDRHLCAVPSRRRHREPLLVLGIVELGEHQRFAPAVALRNIRASSSMSLREISGSSWSAFRSDDRLMVASVTGVSLVTLAERGPPSSAAISPKWSPGTSRARNVPPAVTAAWPFRTT